jgi:hypothetical protein
MVQRCLHGLQSRGIARCAIFVLANNAAGHAFWQACGWHERWDLCAMQIGTAERNTMGTEAMVGGGGRA